MAGRILVLDDEENYAAMLQDLLREHNYCVDMATRPERAIDQLKEIPYDLVISDYKMPVMDGADFLKRSRELYPNLPFILVSGLMNTPELVKVANMSVTLVMEKPLDTATFLSHVARFSSPMTDEEKEREILESELAEETAAQTCPGEPRYFSANNYLANRFIQRAWSIAKEGHELYILEPDGGDAELALKDISYWRGNEDRPVDVLTLAGSDEAAIGQLRDLLAADSSHVVGLRLSSVIDIERAKKITEQAHREIENSDALLLAYIITTDGVNKEFEDATAGLGVILPRLALRPSDVASYASRIARVAAERMGCSENASFTPEAVYALLAYEWPRNYHEIQESVTQMVSANANNGSIPLDVLSKVLPVSVEVVAPDRRIATLMKLEQDRYITEQIDHAGFNASDLATRLELDSPAQTKDDLLNLPLLRGALDTF